MRRPKFQIVFVKVGSIGRHTGTAVSTPDWWVSNERSSTVAQITYTEFCQVGSTVGHVGTPILSNEQLGTQAHQFCQMINWASQYLAHWHKLHILDYDKWAQHAGTQAHQLCQMINWAPQYQAQWQKSHRLDFVKCAQKAGMQAHQFCEMNNWSPQYLAQWHKLHLLDFVKWAQKAGTQAHQFCPMNN